VTVVLDGGPPELAAHDGAVRVVIARRRGRDAADDEIVHLLEAAADPDAITVATSDAALAQRARALGARVEGAGTFRNRLEG
jgi:rRNA-processing protein FCF1